LDSDYNPYNLIKFSYSSLGSATRRNSKKTLSRHCTDLKDLENLTPRNLEGAEEKDQFLSVLAMFLLILKSDCIGRIKGIQSNVNL
jgi:hypothetical protein